jgi:hypothetical protein
MIIVQTSIVREKSTWDSAALLRRFRSATHPLQLSFPYDTMSGCFHQQVTTLLSGKATQPTSGGKKSPNEPIYSYLKQRYHFKKVHEVMKYTGFIWHCTLGRIPLASPYLTAAEKRIFLPMSVSSNVSLASAYWHFEFHAITHINVFVTK